MMLRAEKEEQKEKATMSVRRSRHTYAVWHRAAAAVIITSFIAWSALRFIKRDDALSSRENEHFGRIENGATAIDEKTVVFLYDGTKVWLNADSRLTYPSDLGKRETRDVYLEGEAFFDVAPNASKPFIVHTASIRIKVMGTSFNVKSYKTAKTVETALVEGKVRIEQSNVAGKRIGDVELKPNQLAVFDKESKVINIKEIVAEKSGAWKEDRLVFDAQPMDYVILQMEKWYGVDIHISNEENLSCRLTASIEDESLGEILKLIEASHNVAFRIEGTDVFMDGTLCENAAESSRLEVQN
jgi:transmembrane sensor